MDASKARELREFVEACKKDPSLLADPNLAFFRDYLERSAASLPPPVPSICVPRVHLILCLSSLLSFAVWEPKSPPPPPPRPPPSTSPR